MKFTTTKHLLQPSKRNDLKTSRYREASVRLPAVAHHKWRTIKISAGQVVTEIDQNKLKTQYTYDVRGLETEVRSQSKGSDGQVVTYIQRTVYDAVGHAIYSNSYVEGTPNEKINGSRTEYDRDGRNIRNEQLLGLVIGINVNGNSFVESTGTVLASSSTVYNNAGWVISSTDSYGLVTEYVYNVFGETTQTRRQLIGGGWMVSETVYDSQGRVTFSTDSHLEGSSSSVYGTKSIYDSQGRSVGSVRYVGCKITIAADGSSSVTTSGTEVYRTATEYDSKGRVASSTDANGNTTTYGYDKFDRQIKVKQSNGLITETVYNAKGQVEKNIVKSGSEERITKYKYDEFGNIEETIQPDGTSISAKYNSKGQKISETNQLGQTRSFEYDDNGQLVKVTLPEINGQKPVYEYTYDAQGNQLTIKDPNGNVTTFTYEVNGNQSSRTLPDGSTETFKYDDKGQLIEETSFERVITTYQYDRYDRLESKTFKTAAGETETWTYIYDEYGRVKEVHQGDRITYTKYNEQGQVEYIQTSEGSVSYTYDKFGRQTSVKTDNDTPTEYSYDNFGRLSQVKSGNEATSYTYDTFGNLIQTVTKTDSQTIAVKYVYDNMNRLRTLTNYVDQNKDNVFAADERVSQFDYVLDLLGRKDFATEKFWSQYGEQNNIIDWEYDAAGRLVYEDFNHYNDEFDQTSEWLYDLVGNRLKQTVNDKVTTYDYDVNDRLLNEVTENKTTVYGYDHTQQTSKSVSENGILISETTFEYDAQGRMSIVTIVAGSRTEKTIYGYGADGIRVSAEHEVWEDGELKSKTKTEYLNDPLNITGYSQVFKQIETDVVTGEETVTTYVIGHQRISQTVKENGETKENYFTFDGHGSTRALLDFTGAIVQLYSFDAYGNALGFNPTEALTEFLYSGEQFDAKIGQQYLRARYYDPATGRFNRLDPFFGNATDPQSFHKYLYTHADPVNAVDPKGLMSVGVACAVSLGTFMAIGGISAIGTGIFRGSQYDGTNLGTAKVWIEAISSGTLQGWLNCVNGSQDAVVGILNIPGMAMNGCAFVISGHTIVGYIPSPDWSKNAVTEEDEIAHAWSKFVGGHGLITLLTLGASQVGTATNLSHMTSEVSAASINSQGVLLGRQGIFALQGASQSSWINWARTLAANAKTAVPIPQPALQAFNPIPAVGPISLWTRMMGGYVSYSNALNLQSGVTTGAPLMTMYLTDWFLGIGVNFAAQTGSGIIDGNF